MNVFPHSIISASVERDNPIGFTRPGVDGVQCERADGSVWPVRGNYFVLDLQYVCQ